MRRFRVDPQVVILLAFTAILLAPLTAPGYFIYAHDARHTVYFLQMFDAALRDGALYPRWATDMTFGYGYPVWLILAPLPYYVGELFHLLGLDFVTSVKAVDAVALVASGLTMYLFASRVFGKNAGLVAAVAYLFVPYHVVDLYVRGAQAEYLSFAFLPLILWALYQFFTTRRLFYVPIVALAYAGLILAHISMAVIFSPVIGAYVLMGWVAWRPRTADKGQDTGAEPHPSRDRETTADDRPPIEENAEKKNQPLFFYGMPILAIVWGFLLSAVFLLPVVLEHRYLTSEPLIGGFFDFRKHFVFLSQLLSPFWGYGYAGINGTDQFSLQLGVLPLFFGIVALVAAKRDAIQRAHLTLFALVTLGAVVLMLALSAPLWEIASPIIAFAQFPWRLLIVTAFALAVLAGAAVRAVAPEEAFAAGLLLALLLAGAMFPNARPQYTDAVFTLNTLMDFEVKDRELLGDTIWMAPDKRPQDSPLVDQYRAGQITQKAVPVEGNAIVELVEHRSQGDTVRVNASSPARIMFYTRYFPGWTAQLDGAPVAVEPYGEQGLLSVAVPPDTHTLTTRFGDTPVRTLGTAISLASLLAALVWLWKTR